VNTSTKLSPPQQNENPVVPSLVCGDRVWKAAELIHALRRGSGVARAAIYDMTTHCVRRVEPARADCRDTIEEVTTCVLAAVHHGALRRAEFLPNFIEIVTRAFLRQQSRAQHSGAAAAVVSPHPAIPQAPPASRRPRRLRSQPARRRAIHAK
jgi:hypothetical protein